MAATETISFRSEPTFKENVDTAARAEGRSMAEYITRAVERYMAPQCGVCGRSDRPTGGAGLSEKFERFVAEVKEKPAAIITVTVAEWDHPRVYCGHLSRETSQGLLLLVIVLDNGGTTLEAVAPIPCGLISGFQEDSSDGKHYERMMRLRNRSGNDLAIRGALRAGYQSVTTLRLVSEAVCASPGLTIQQHYEALRLSSVPNALGTLQFHGLVEKRENRLFPVYPDPDEALQAARRKGLDIDIRS